MRGWLKGAKWQGKKRTFLRGRGGLEQASGSRAPANEAVVVLRQMQYFSSHQTSNRILLAMYDQMSLRKSL